MITIRNIIINQSRLNFILFVIYGASQFNLVNFIITHSSIYKGIIYVPLIVSNFNIQNMIFRFVYFFEARMIELFSEFLVGNATAQDINFYNCDLHKTIFLKVK